jgi:hypothetical protein
MKTLHINFSRCNFEQLIVWFESVGHPCLERRIHTARARDWDIGINYQHFEVRIFNDELFTIASLRWA